MTPPAWLSLLCADPCPAFSANGCPAHHLTNDRFCTACTPRDGSAMCWLCARAHRSRDCGGLVVRIRKLAPPPPPPGPTCRSGQALMRTGGVRQVPEDRNGVLLQDVGGVLDGLVGAHGVEQHFVEGLVALRPRRGGSGACAACGPGTGGSRTRYCSLACAAGLLSDPA